MEFQKRKVTKEILEEMKKLRENKSYKKIAEKNIITFIKNRMKKEEVKKLKKDIKKLRKNNSYKKIAEHFNLHISMVMYHLNEKTRNKIKERRRNYQIKDLEGYRKYQRQYQNYRYSNDKEFREKKRKESFDYYRKNRKVKKC